MVVLLSSTCLLVVDLQPIKLKLKCINFQVLSIKALNGYDDLNFHLTVELSANGNPNIDSVCSAGYVAKVMNALDSELNYQHVGACIHYYWKM